MIYLRASSNFTPILCTCYFFFKEKIARNWFTYFSYSYTVSSRMDFRDHTLFYFEGLCLCLKNNPHYCTGVFFHWDHSFLHHYHLWEWKHSSPPAKFAYLHTHNKKCSCCLTGFDRREKWSFILGAQVSCTSVSYEID